MYLYPCYAYRLNQHGKREPVIVRSIFHTKYEITQEDKNLIDIALKVLAENFDDGIYNHTVGCAILCKNGRIYKGVNCDGIHGSCAEYVTMGIAISAGEREFDTIVAVHDKHLNCVIPPCGNCRQMLFEYCPDIKVIVNDEKYSLQGTTQGRYLTGGVPPVRFSM